MYHMYHMHSMHIKDNRGRRRARSGQEAGSIGMSRPPRCSYLVVISTPKKWRPGWRSSDRRHGGTDIKGPLVYHRTTYH